MFYKKLQFFLGLGLMTASSATAGNVYFGAGVIFQNMLTTTTSPEGSASLPGSLYLPALNLSFRLPWGLAPSIYYTPVSKVQSDEVTKKILIVQAPFLFRVNDKLSWKLGPGFQIYTVGGDGATVTLNNGTGTATFYHPGSSKSSTNLLIAGGLAWSMNPSWRLDLDLFMPGILSTRRSFTLGCSLNWGVF